MLLLLGSCFSLRSASLLRHHGEGRREWVSRGALQAGSLRGGGDAIKEISRSALQGRGGHPSCGLQFALPPQDGFRGASRPGALEAQKEPRFSIPPPKSLQSLLSPLSRPGVTCWGAPPPPAARVLDARCITCRGAPPLPPPRGALFAPPFWWRGRHVTTGKEMNEPR